MKKNAADKRKTAVRVVCIVLAVILVSSTLFAALGILAL